jgi:hypothetical protein
VLILGLCQYTSSNRWPGRERLDHKYRVITYIIDITRGANYARILAQLCTGRRDQIGIVNTRVLKVTLWSLYIGYPMCAEWIKYWWIK